MPKAKNIYKFFFFLFPWKWDLFLHFDVDVKSFNQEYCLLVHTGLKFIKRKIERRVIEILSERWKYWNFIRRWLSKSLRKESLFVCSGNRSSSRLSWIFRTCLCIEELLSSHFHVYVTLCDYNDRIYLQFDQWRGKNFSVRINRKLLQVQTSGFEYFFSSLTFYLSFRIPPDN